MTYEVELKFRVDDVGPIRRLLDELGAARPSRHAARPVLQPPVARFRAVQRGASRAVAGRAERRHVQGAGARPRGEDAARDRASDRGHRGRGGRVRLDASCAARLPPGAQRGEDLRELFHLEWDGVPMELALDSVAGLGSFVELETLADDATRRPPSGGARPRRTARPRAARTPVLPDDAAAAGCQGRRIRGWGGEATQ